MRMIVASVLTLCSAAALAQGARLTVGEMIYASDTQQWKVLACRQRPEVTWRKCEVQLWENGAPAATPSSWQDEQMMVKGDARIRSATGRPPRAGMETAGRCAATPYGGTVPGSHPPSAALFRRKIADLYAFRNSPRMTVGVAFEQVRVGAPVRNVIRQVPGVGSRRVNDAAPVDASLYPVASTYTVCEGYPGSGERSRYVNTHYCFVARDGNWACGGGGGPPPRISRIESW